MKYLLIFWGLPMGFLWGWFGLSYYDMHFGMPFLTRSAHDFVFDTYGATLGIDPAIIPPLVAKACVVDSAILFGLFGLKRRKQIWAWWNERRSLTPMQPAMTRADQAPPAE
ncbi:MAG: DUF6105 family protein [Mesorhizobium sp.]|nr:DUF6105 family protein [Mesorhizobium sp.]